MAEIQDVFGEREYHDMLNKVGEKVRFMSPDGVKAEIEGAMNLYNEGEKPYKEKSRIEVETGEMLLFALEKFDKLGTVSEYESFKLILQKLDPETRSFVRKSTYKAASEAKLNLTPPAYQGSILVRSQLAALVA